MTRSGLGKRLRFEVFKRDSFTCHYCGSKPPEVVLEVDHVVPLAAGGGHAFDNLVTACEACNRGKGRFPLLPMATQTDGDLLDELIAAQQMAELKRWRQLLREQVALMSGVIESLQCLWMWMSALDWAPSEATLWPLVEHYSMMTAAQAVRDVAEMFGSGQITLTAETNLKAYFLAAARREAREEDE